MQSTVIALSPRARPNRQRWLNACASSALLALGISPMVALAQTTVPVANGDAGQIQPGQADGSVGGQPPRTGTAGEPAPAAQAPIGTEAATDTAEGDDIVVTGIRASVRSAQQIKRNAEQIVDSIAAEDIGKLPDRNVAEALQRISGVQVERNFGEGSSIAIRGLTQVRTEVNGRDSFTANGGRGLSFEDVPSELLAGIDIYKNPSADLIEGGIGGLVNLRTRKPFDFAGPKFAASFGLNHYDLVDQTEPQASALVSYRWNTPIGQVGILANVSYQRTAFRQDTVSTEPFYTFGAGTDLGPFPGRGNATTTVPSGAGIGQVQGDRQRFGTDIAVQWRPTDRLEFTGEMFRAQYNFVFRDYSFFAFTGTSNIIPSTIDPPQFDSNGEFIRGSFVDVPTASNTSFSTRDSVTTDYSLNGKWNPTDRLNVSADFQYIKGTSSADRAIVSLSPPNTTVTQDLSGAVPVLTLPTGAGFTNPANYGLGYYLDNIDDSSAREYAGRLDAEYKFDGALKSIKVGGRYTNRRANNASTSYRNFVGFFGGPGTLPDSSFYEVFDTSSFFRGRPGLFGDVLAFPLAILNDYGSTRRKLATQLPDAAAAALIAGQSYLPSDRNTQVEKTYAGYATARFGLDDFAVPFDGNIGVRVVRTESRSNGFLSQTPQVRVLNPDGSPAFNGDGSPAFQNGVTSFDAVNADSNYTKFLPSLNLRFRFTERLQLRLAGSKALTRPDFSQLNPNLSITQPNPATPNPVRPIATGGNPFLRPLESDQFDASLEWYFSNTGLLYAAGFYKKIDGFIASTVTPETYTFGNTSVVYDVNRPANGDDGKVKGIEIGGNTFFDFLPGLLSGFGVQANFTYVDSEAPSPTAIDTGGARITVPLEGLSKYSYNLIGLYEKGPVSFRAAYNWRSRYVRTTAGNGTRNLPIYSNAFGQLDASVTYSFNDHVAFTVDGTNLTNTRRDTIFGLDTRPRDSVLNDRRISGILRLNF